MYRLKHLLFRHIEENTIKYVAVLVLFAVGIVFGFFFSRTVSRELSEVLFGELAVMLEMCFAGNVDVWQIVASSFLKNLRVFVFVFVGGLALWLMPLVCIVIVAYGFSVGFTIGYMAFGFGGQGVCVTALSLMPSFFINIPVYIILSVIAINNSINKRLHRGGGGYVAIFILVFLISMISVFVDGFFVPSIIRLICS